MNEDDLPDGDFPWIADIRDDVLAQFHSLYPRRLFVEEMTGYFMIDGVLAQLVIAELISQNLLDEHDDGSLLLTDAGLHFAEARLIKRPGWADYCVRPSAPAWPGIGRRLTVAMNIHAACHPESIASRMIHQMQNA